MIIGIAGAKRSGKTTLAELLARRYGLAHISFAAPIRAFVADLLGGTLEQLEEHKESPVAWLDGVTPRHMMQTLGTEWGRDIVHSELWVRAAMRRAEIMGRVVISDVRFPNEAEAIRERGGIILRVHRGASAASGDAHRSEMPLPDHLVHAELRNDGSVVDLLALAVDAIERHSAANDNAPPVAYVGAVGGSD